jgi:hypothetical protein
MFKRTSANINRKLKMMNLLRRLFKRVSTRRKIPETRIIPVPREPELPLEVGCTVIRPEGIWFKGKQGIQVAMEVIHINGDEVICQWNDNGTKRMVFKNTSLQVVKSAKD